METVQKGHAMTRDDGEITPTIFQGDAPNPTQRLLRDPVDAYLAGLAPASQDAVRKRLRAVARLAGAASYTALPWGQLREYDVAFIRQRLIQSGAAPATVNLTLAALRGVARAARNASMMSDEEYRRITEIKPDGGTRLPAGRSTSGGELSALVEACDRDPGAAGVRDAAMLAVLYTGGLRRSEVAKLTLAAYTPDPPTLRVQGKGRKQREVPLPTSAHAPLAAWLAVRGDAPGGLFLPISHGGRIIGGSITAQAVNNMLIKRASQAGVDHLSPHDLRRTFVSTLLDKGADISTVQQLAGHASVTTTQRYDRRGEATKRQAVDLLHFPASRRARVAE